METEFGDGGVQSIFVSGVELMLSWGFDNLYTEQISAMYQFYEKHISDDPLILYQSQTLILPSSVTVPAQAWLSWFYSQLIQPSTHQPGNIFF